MASSKPGTDSRIQLRRTFTAPRERVFGAWTEPHALTQWFSPQGYETPSAEVDLRVGGQYRIGMRQLPDGDVFYVGGTYQEIRPPERLVCTWRWEGEPGHSETLVTVEFRDLGGSTEIVITHERFLSEKERDEHERGWGSCLDRLTDNVFAAQRG